MEHAHELPEFLHFLEELIEEHSILRGFIFGFIHTLIPVSYTHLRAHET